MLNDKYFMDLIETYSLLFADNLMEALVLPPHTGYVLKVMLGFGGYQPMLMLLFASLGGIIGTLANWGLGRMFITCRDREWVIVETPKLDKCTAFFRKYLAWLLLFSWFPGMGGVIAVIGGFSKVRFWVALLLVTIGIAAYYGIILFRQGLLGF